MIYFGLDADEQKHFSLFLMLKIKHKNSMLFYV
jgi:hypothetical protein